MDLRSPKTLAKIAAKEMDSHHDRCVEECAAFRRKVYTTAHENGATEEEAKSEATAAAKRFLRIYGATFDYEERRIAAIMSAMNYMTPEQCNALPEDVDRLVLYRGRVRIKAPCLCGAGSNPHARDCNVEGS